MSNKLRLPNVQIASTIDPVGERVFQRDVDYHHPESRLALVRYYNSQYANTNFGFGKGWNMTYAIHLKRSSKHQLKLMQSDGREISFTQKTNENSKRFNSINHQDGYLEKKGKYWQWNKNDTDQVLFRGPIPVKFIFGENSTLHLHYKNQRLNSVTDEHDSKILFHYDHSLNEMDAKVGISAVTLPNGKTISYEYKDEKLINTRSDQPRPRRYFYQSGKAVALLTGTSESDKEPRYQISYNTAGQPHKWQNTTNGQTININYSTSKNAKQLTESKIIDVTTNTGESATYHVLTDSQTHQSKLVSSRIQLCSSCSSIERQYRYNSSTELVPNLNSASQQALRGLESTDIALITKEHNLISGLATIRAGINSFSFKYDNADSSEPVTIRNKRIIRKLLITALTPSASSRLDQRDDFECELNGPQGPQIEPLIEPTDPDSQETEPVCSSTAHPSGEAILPASIVSTIEGGHIREIWADGCLSYFDAYIGTGRGFKIEEALALHPDFTSAFATATLFPVVDFLLEGTAVAVVSTDLTSASYNNSAPELALYHALLQDAEEMYDKFLGPLEMNGQVSATQGGLTTTIREEDVDSFVFELVIQHNTATPEQITQILQAAEYMLQHFGIILQIVEIP